MIRIGIESRRSELIAQILSHPERYFSVLILDGCPVLCIQTCDNRGEDVVIKILDRLAHDNHGDLISLFHQDLCLGVLERGITADLIEGEQYPISESLRENLSEAPDFIEWITRSILVNGRGIILHIS